MTEDMRERTLNMCDKHTVQLFAGENCDICRMQAALSSAGTSGTCPECQSPDRAIRYCSECNLPLTDHTHPTSAFVACRNSWHGGDSLSGKGEAIPTVTGIKEHIVTDTQVMAAPDRAEVMGKDGKPDHFRDAEEMVAPDRAEELARKCADTIKAHETSYAQRESDLWRWACTCGKMETVDSRDACVSATQHHWGQAVASLLREASDKCPTCGLTIVPRLCANPACASSVKR